MAGEKKHSLCGGCDDWLQDTARKAIIKTEDREVLRLFDEEAERIQREAEVEVYQMKKDGLMLENK